MAEEKTSYRIRPSAQMLTSHRDMPSILFIVGKFLRKSSEFILQSGAMPLFDLRYTINPPRVQSMTDVWRLKLIGWF